MSFAAPNRRLYVGRIPQTASRLDVEDHFGSLGPKPVDVKLLNGYGFIEFDSVNDAEDAMREFDGRDFMGDRLLVQFAKASADRRPRYDDGGSRDSYRSGGDSRGGGGGRSQGWRLQISNLPNGCSWQDLKDFARTAGSVHYAEVSRQDASEGVIEYMSFTDASAAVKQLDGVDMRGSVVRVIEGTAPPGQSWSDPRPSPPRGDDRDDRRGGGGRRDRSRSPAGRRGDDRDRRDDRRGGGRDDRDDRRGGGGGYDSDRRDRDRDRYDDRRGSDRDGGRRDRSRSPPRYRDRSPRY